MICGCLTQSQWRWANKEKGEKERAKIKRLDPRTSKLLWKWLVNTSKFQANENWNPPVFFCCCQMWCPARFIHDCLSADDPLKRSATMSASLIAIPLCNYTMSWDKSKEMICLSHRRWSVVCFMADVLRLMCETFWMCDLSLRFYPYWLESDRLQWDSH